MEKDLIQKFENYLPEFFWLVEASAPELFSSSRRKFGEVLISAQAQAPTPLDLSLMLAARLPGMAIIRQGNDVPIDKTQLQGHTPLFSL